MHATQGNLIIGGVFWRSKFEHWHSYCLMRRSHMVDADKDGLCPFEGASLLKCLTEFPLP